MAGTVGASSHANPPPRHVSELAIYLHGSGVSVENDNVIFYIPVHTAKVVGRGCTVPPKAWHSHPEPACVTWLGAWRMQAGAAAVTVQ